MLQIAVPEYKTTYIPAESGEYIPENFIRNFILLLKSVGEGIRIIFRGEGDFFLNFIFQNIYNGDDVIVT